MLAIRKNLYLVGLFSSAFLTLLYQTGYCRSGGKILWVPNFDGTVRDILWASPDPNEPIPFYWRDWIERVPVFTMATAILTSANSSPWTVDPTWNAANNSVELVGAGGKGAAGTTGSGSSGGGGGGSAQYVKLTNGALGATVPFIFYTSGISSFGTVFEDSSTGSHTNCYIAGSGFNASGTTHGNGGNVISTIGTPAVTFTVSLDRAGANGGNSGANLGGGGGGGTPGALAAGGTGALSATANGGGGGGSNNGATGNGSGQTGGTGSSGTGGGAGNPGTNGTGNSGGGGGNTVSAGLTVTGGNGGSGTDFDVTAGLGGGGGGSGQNTNNTAGETSTGGSGGLYGGGGGGCGGLRGTTSPTFTVGVGGAGVIALTWVALSTFVPDLMPQACL